MSPHDRAVEAFADVFERFGYLVATSTGRSPEGLTVRIELPGEDTYVEPDIVLYDRQTRRIVFGVEIEDTLPDKQHRTQWLRHIRALGDPRRYMLAFSSDVAPTSIDRLALYLELHISGVPAETHVCTYELKGNRLVAAHPVSPSLSA